MDLLQDEVVHCPYCGEPVGLQLDPTEVPSPLIDKPAPAFEVAQLHKPDARIGTEELRGKGFEITTFGLRPTWSRIRSLPLLLSR